VPNVLLFATGGLAYGGMKASTTLEQIWVTTVPPPPSFSTGSISETRVGYAVGAEWMFWSSLSAKFEYLYYDLGRVDYNPGGLAADVGPTTFPGFGIASVATSSSTKFSGSDIRVGINYHLN
jgi:outer membrane immunogenic protein